MELYMFIKISKQILKVWERRQKARGLRSYPAVTEKKLSILDPSADSGILVRDYYLQKIQFMMKMLMVGMFFLVILIFKDKADNPLGKGDILKRNETGEGSSIYNLEAKLASGTKEKVQLELLERQLTKDEQIKEIEKVTQLLPTLIIGENKSLQHIEKSLVLPDKIEGYQVRIRWETSDYQLMDEDGSIGEKEVSASGEKIVLTAILICGEETKEVSLEGKIFPPVQSSEKSVQDELMELIQKGQEKSKYISNYQLPQMLGTEKIEWSEEKNKMFIYIVFAIPILCITISFGKDRDLQKKIEQKNKSLLMEYSEFVSKLQLLIGCGMTMRSAFEKMKQDYSRTRKAGGDKKEVYEELQNAVNRFQSGHSETEVYDFFGKRCGLLCYRKLTSLILQNLDKGTDGLLEALENESRVAFSERKQLAKRLGEEAQTKLLLPMAIMLVIVMLMILIPAYLSFGGI